MRAQSLGAILHIEHCTWLHYSGMTQTGAGQAAAAALLFMSLGPQTSLVRCLAFLL